MAEGKVGKKKCSLTIRLISQERNILQLSSYVIIGNFYILKKFYCSYFDVFNGALNCRPGLLVTIVLVGLTWFLSFHFCYFLWHF